MEALLLYWLKANAVLALFAAAYYGLLRRLTFFALNRAYLLLALLFAAAYPLLPVPALLPAMATGPLPLLASAGAASPAVAGAPVVPGLDWWLLAGAVYLAGAGALLLRLLGQLLSLALLHRRTRPAVVLGQAVRVVPGAGGPFSFGRAIYLPESALADAAALPAALRHEQAHVQQGHTLDVLLLQLATALAWANPAAWLLRRLALDNLEYLADEAALHGAALSRREYQYLLLQQQLAGPVPAPALAFHFSFFTLKNRVLMLNSPLSTKRQLGRYLLAAPLVMLLALGYTGARAQALLDQTYTLQLAGPNAPTKPFRATLLHPDHPAYYVDARPSTAEVANALKNVASIDVVQNPATVRRYAQDPAATGIVFVTTTANAHSPEVLRLADEANLSSAYNSEPAQVSAVVPKALVYITTHYPDARLSGEVMKLTQKSTGAVKYQVQLARGRRPFWVYFSPEGEYLGE